MESMNDIGNNRILIITQLYPADDIQFKNNTSVCHYFAKDWVKMGYAVRVINLYNEYPAYYYPLLRIAKNVFADKFGIAILDKRIHGEHDYNMDGIKVTRIPAYKGKPHGDFSEKVIKALANRINEIIQEEDYTPDYILGHFIQPCARVIAELKKLYPQAVTTTALHGKVFKLTPSVQACLPKIDYIGFRSYPIKRSFESIYGTMPYFMCMSGVPEEYIADSEKIFSNGIHHFVYVGAFMRRKYPSLIIPAVTNNYPNRDFTITYIGDGNGASMVRKVAEKQNVTRNIIFTGRIPRSNIKEKLDESEVFIMISENETFGLVWLEAMARGCITVASRDEGMDGIIEDGVNGFLCKAGDSDELSSIITKIKSMDKVALRTMSRKAIETAKRMTDSKMAKDYLSGICANK